MGLLTATVDPSELILGTQPEVVWHPQPGPQTALLQCPMAEIFYGGARGGGKTDGLLGHWLAHWRTYGTKARGVLFRRTYTPELEEVIARTQEVFPKVGATYNAGQHTWTFPDGTILRLRHLDNDIDAANYLGHQYTWVAVDQAEQFPNPDPIDKLRGSMRSVHGVPCTLILTGNPGGPGHHWLKQRYIAPARGGFTPIRYQPQPEMRPDLWCEAVFIPAKLEDNPLLMSKDVQYADRLAASGGQALYKAWRFGDWDAIVGAVFAEWRADLHVIPLRGQLRLPVPFGWRLAAGMDWGNRHPGCWVLFAAGPEAIIGVDELYFRGKDARDVGLAIGQRCRSWGMVEYIACDEQAWYATGTGAPTVAEEVQMGIFEAYGTQGRHLAPALIQATHGPGSRLTKLQVMRRYLAWTGDAKGTVQPWGMPKLRFTETCANVIRTIPALPFAPESQGRGGHAKDDVDTRAEDHPYDAVTAYLMSRPPEVAEPLTEEPVGIAPRRDPATGKRYPRWMEDKQRQLEERFEREQSGLVRYPGNIV